MTGEKGPTWICTFPDRPSTYASGPRPSDAVAVCESAGLGTPSAVNYAGYNADPDPPAQLDGSTIADLIPLSPPKSTRRAELVLTLYGLLRCDFPIGSILRPEDAANRLPSASVLRDFLANVGTAIERLRNDPRNVYQVIESQGKAWIASAQETNSRRAGKWKAAEVYAERKIRYRQHAKRLRKRVGYRKAIAELAHAIDGILPEQESTAENFRSILAKSGIGPDDVESLVSRYRRITAPKL